VLRFPVERLVFSIVSVLFVWLLIVISPEENCISQDDVRVFSVLLFVSHVVVSFSGIALFSHVDDILSSSVYVIVVLSSLICTSFTGNVSTVGVDQIVFSIGSKVSIDGVVSIISFAILFVKGVPITSWISSKIMILN
jgi:hypothetical protein